MSRLKQSFLVGIAAHAVLCVLAVVFYKERMVKPDDANYIFDLVTNGGHFAIFHHRFIAVLTQWMPYLAVKRTCSLQTVALVYSLNIALFYLCVYLLCVLVFRSYKTALVLLFFNLLLTTHTAYWVVSELTQGIALLLLAFGGLTGDDEGSKGRALSTILIPALLLTVVACTHGLILFPAAFIFAFFWLDRPRERRKLLFASAFYGAGLLIKALFLHDEYDRHAMSGLKNFFRLFPDYLTESLWFFLRSCAGIYCWVPVLILIIGTHYFRTKSWKKMGLMVVSFFGYLLLTTVTFPGIEGNGFYNENLFLPLAVMLAVPLVFDVFPAMRKQALALGLTVLIAGTGLVRIWMYQRTYAERLTWQRNLIRQYDNQKVIFPETAFPKDTLLIAWSSPYEFWLLSTMETGKTASLLIAKDPEKYLAQAGNDKKVFLTTYINFSYGQMPPAYFQFRDTVSMYRIQRSGQ